MSPTSTPPLRIEALGYRYPNGHRAIENLDLTLSSGIVGLLGPNGAGKSTLMRVLATLARPTTGHVLWNGVDIALTPDAVRAELGYLPQDFGVYTALSAVEFLRFLAAVKGLPGATIAERVDECLALVGLAEVRARRLGDFSGGMRQRVGIAQALLNDPKLLIVDEPTVGLDPEERLRFRHLLTDLAGERLVILSTHIVSDIEASASAIAVMAQGQLRFYGDIEHLVAQAQGKVWDWTIAAEQLAAARAGHHVSSSRRVPGGVQLRIVAEARPSADAEPAMPDLEDAYVCLLAQSKTC